MMPILHLPGEMMPGQFGPITRVLRTAQVLFRLDHVRYRDALGNTNDKRKAGIGCFHYCVRSKGRRHINDRGVRPVSRTASATVLNTATPSCTVPPLPGVNAANNVGAVLTHLQHMKGAFFACNALNDEAGVLID
jgi:hypothetical protein